MIDVTFTVRVTQDKEAWMVAVSDHTSMDYAKTFAPQLDQALKMALPYMADVAMPTPWSDTL